MKIGNEHKNKKNKKNKKYKDDIDTQEHETVDVYESAKPIMEYNDYLYDENGAPNIEAMNIVSKELGYENNMPKILKNKETYLELDDKVICPLLIQQFPQGEASLDTFQSVLKAQKHSYVSIVIRPAKISVQIRDLQKQKETNEAKLIDSGLNDMERTKIHAKIDEINTRLRELALSTRKNFLTSVSTVVEAPKEDVLEERLNDVRLSYTRLNLQPKRPNMNILSEIINHSVSTKHPSNFESYETFSQDSLATLIPFRERDVIGEGNNVGINLDTGHPVIFDFFQDVEGINFENKNMILLGINGSGKTFTAQTFFLGSLSQGPVTAIVDSESQFAGTVEGVGGINVSFKQSSTNKYGFNFFDVAETNAFKTIDKIKQNHDGTEVVIEEDVMEDYTIIDLVSKNNELLDVIETMFLLTTNKIISPNQRMLITKLITRIYADFGITSNVDSIYEYDVYDSKGNYVAKRKKQMPTIGSFVHLIYTDLKEVLEMRKHGKYNEDEFIIKNQYTFEDLTELYTSLSIFSKKHNGTKTMFDVQTKEGDELSNWSNVPAINFDISDLIAKPDAILTPLVLKIVFKWLKGNFANSNLELSKVAMIDELFRFVSPGSPWTKYVASDIEDFYRTFRKRNARIITMSQNVIELNNDVGKAIIAQSAFKVLLRHNQTDFDTLVETLKVSPDLANKVTRIGNNPGEFYMQIGSENDILHVKGSATKIHADLIAGSYLRGKHIKEIIEKKEKH